MPKIISLFNHKGGVGKTTVAHNLAVSLTKQGKNVLLIDADPQMNLTSSVLGLADSVEYADKNESKWREAREKYTKITDYLDWCTTKFIRQDQSFEPKLYDYNPEKNVLFENGRGKLSLLCGDIKLFEIESRIYSIVTSKVNRNDGTVYAIEEGIRNLGEGYDYIIVDTSPSANSVLNGIMVLMADYFLCPVFPNFFSLQAIDNLFEVTRNWISLLSDFQATVNNKGLSFNPKFLGIVINMSKRFEKGGETKTTIYAEKWRSKLNDSIGNFYTKMLDSGRTLTKEEFKKVFSNVEKSEPFIIAELCDFTGQIRNIAEKSGVPVVDLTRQIVSNTIKKINTDNPTRKMTDFNINDTKIHYGKAFKAVTESYEYVAKCISENL